MAFNSFDFVVFFICFFILYWAFGKSARFQNLLLLGANCFFYAYADWKFSFLLLAYSLINFYLGLAVYKSRAEVTQKWLSRFSVLLGVGLLLYFKYFNFFIENFSRLFSLIHLQANVHTLKILLPLGISFYIFRTLSYTLDIYYRKMKPGESLIDFLCFVSFFPTIVAGPIDRARVFLPQLEKKRTFDFESSADGMRQILWGLFKKAVIADSCAPLVDEIFATYHIQSGSTLLLGAFLYGFQLYGDFSGYSDMAIGIGKLIGFNVTRNFAYPFFALNISDYWRKWHISLTSWLTDYVFTPMAIAFRDFGKPGTIFAVIITFLIIGAWHEANWTWIFYGLLNGLLFIPLILKGNVLRGGGVIAKGRMFPSFGDAARMISTFVTVVLLYIVNRSATISDAAKYINLIFSRSFFCLPAFIHGTLFTLITIMMIVEWLNRDKQHGLQIDGIRQSFIRWTIYYLVIIAILLYQSIHLKFIYLQF